MKVTKSIMGGTVVHFTRRELIRLAMGGSVECREAAARGGEIYLHSDQHIRMVDTVLKVFAENPSPYEALAKCRELKQTP